MAPQDIVKNNPNATAAVAGGAPVAVLVTWLVGNVFHWPMSTEDGAAIGSCASAAIVFFGRCIHGLVAEGGIRGLWRKIVGA